MADSYENFYVSGILYGKLKAEAEEEYAGQSDIPMRDGIKLATDIYLPKGIREPVPAVLVRTPYGKEEGSEVYYRYVQRGYAVEIMPPG